MSREAISTRRKHLSDALADARQKMRAAAQAYERAVDAYNTALAAVAESGRDLRDHTIALLFGKDRIPPKTEGAKAAEKIA